MNYFASQADYDNNRITQRDEYGFDAYGRRSVWVRYESTSGDGVSPAYNAGGSIAEDANFAAVRN
ncbi:MAG: hypothetical protein AAF958_08345, partial [Planctomycetota bacterium]